MFAALLSSVVATDWWDLAHAWHGQGVGLPSLLHLSSQPGRTQEECGVTPQHRTAGQGFTDACLVRGLQYVLPICKSRVPTGSCVRKCMWESWYCACHCGKWCNASTIVEVATP
jgi:hypothetical protein